MCLDVSTCLHNVPTKKATMMMMMNVVGGVAVMDGWEGGVFGFRHTFSLGTGQQGRTELACRDDAPLTTWGGF